MCRRTSIISVSFITVLILMVGLMAQTPIVVMAQTPSTSGMPSGLEPGGRR